MRVFRIVTSKWAATAFDGEGARLVRGRWHSKGTAMVYTSESAALAAIELLVHLDKARLLCLFVIIAAQIPEECVATIGEGASPALPSHWAQTPAPAACPLTGDQWIAGGHSLALRVPSTVAPHSFNVLINPAHPDFARLTMGEPEEFALDARLIEMAHGSKP